MAGAFGYDLYKSRDLISTELGLGIAVGFALAFIVALIVVRYALDFISKNGFAPFAYWRIFVGRDRAVGRAAVQVAEAPLGRLAVELAVLAEPPEIGGQDRLQRPWGDAEGPASVRFSLLASSDTTLSMLQQLDLVGVTSGLGSSAIGKAISAPIPAAAGTGWLRLVSAAPARPVRDASALRVRRAHRSCPPWPRPRRRGEGIGDVADIDRLEFVLPPNSGITGSMRASEPEQVEEAVARAENDRGTEDDRRRESARALRSSPMPREREGAGRTLVGAQDRHMDEPVGARRPRRLGDIFGAHGIDGPKPLLAALDADRHQIDDDLGAADRGHHRIGVAHIGLDRHDLADSAERPQMAGEVGPPHRDADAVALAGQELHDLRAHEARAAENRDQFG